MSTHRGGESLSLCRVAVAVASRGRSLVARSQSRSADVRAQFCLNLPPWVRYRDKNRLALGWIPGTKEAWDKQSFFFPIVREGRLLAKELEVWHAGLQQDVNMRVHYVLVGADMPERRALMCSSGHQGKSFC